MKVKITAEIIRDGEKKPVRTFEAEFHDLMPERAIGLAKQKTRLTSGKYPRFRKLA